VVEVRPDEQLAFLHAHPVRALWGVGPATFERLQRLGVSTIGDLADLSEQTLVASLGRSAGQHLHQLSQGIDDRDVVVARALKSVGHEQTFARDLYEPAELELEIVRMADAVASRLRAQELAARTVNLKVRYGTFVTITRAQTVPAPVDTAPAIAHAAQGLLAQLDVSAGVRLLGVSVSNLTHHAPRQLSLEVGDGATTTAREWEEASSAIDEIRSRFGDRAIGPASLVSGSEGRRELRIVRRGAQQWGPDQPGGPDQPSGQDSSRRR
jgi:DNA polymerase-4